MLLLLLVATSSLSLLAEAVPETDPSLIYPNLESADSNGYTIFVDDGYLSNVVALGDINGDSLDDFALTSSNEINIFYGSSDDLVSSLTSEHTVASGRGFKITGQDGSSISYGYDINDDGISDLLYQGYVIFGVPGSTPLGTTEYDVSTLILDPSKGIFIDPSSIPPFSAFKGIGDFNGDGIDDLIASLAYESTNSLYQNGLVYVIFGHAGEWEGIPTLNSTNSLVIHGASEDQRFGSFIVSAGNFNGDDKADLVIACANSEEIYVIYGRDTGVGELDMADFVTGVDSGFKVTTLEEGTELGSTADAGVDINNDGRNDIILGAYGAGTRATGEILVLFGRAGISEDVVLEDFVSSSTTGFKITGGESFAKAGSFVSFPGDVNGDSYQDMWIGESWARTGSYIVYGHAGNSFSDTSLSTLTENGYSGKKFVNVNSAHALGRTKSAGEYTLALVGSNLDYPSGGNSAVNVINYVDGLDDTSTYVNGVATVSSGGACDVQVTMDDTVDYALFVSKEVADAGGISLEYAGGESNCEAFTVNSLEVSGTLAGESALVTASAESLIMIFFVGFTPLLLYTGLRMKADSSNRLLLAAHSILALMSALALVYVSVFSFSTSVLYRNDVLASLAAVNLELGFLLETLLVTQWKYFPFFASSNSAYIPMMTTPMVAAMAVVVVSSISAFSTALAASGNPAGFAALVLAITGLVPTVLMGAFAYFSATSSDPSTVQSPNEIMLVGGIIALAQQLAVIFWTVMAFEGIILISILWSNMFSRNLDFSRLSIPRLSIDFDFGLFDRIAVVYLRKGRIHRIRRQSVELCFIDQED